MIYRISLIILVNKCEFLTSDFCVMLIDESRTSDTQTPFLSRILRDLALGRVSSPALFQVTLSHVVLVVLVALVVVDP